MRFRATAEYTLLFIFYRHQCRPWTPRLKPVGLVSSASPAPRVQATSLYQHYHHLPSRITSHLKNKGKVTRGSNEEIQRHPQDASLNLAWAGSDQKDGTVWQLALTARGISCVSLAGWWTSQMDPGGSPVAVPTWPDPGVSPRPVLSEASCHGQAEGGSVATAPSAPVLDHSLAKFRCWTVHVRSGGEKNGIKGQKNSPQKDEADGGL